MPRLLDSSTLRGRLGLGYALTLVIALTAFAVVAVAVVDRAQRTALDAQLESSAGALRIIGDAHDRELTVDAKDREQFRTIVGAKVQSAIMGRRGNIIVATDDRTARRLAAAYRNPQSDAFVDAQGGHLRLYVTPIREAGATLADVFAWSESDSIDTLDRSVGLGFTIAIPAIAFLAMLIGGELARRALAPLGEIASVVAEIEGDDLSRRLALPARSDELGTLAVTFDRMLDRLQRAFDRERRFTSDASHELRAPLSVIRAEADLALRGRRSPAEYRQALETIASECEALETLTRELLTAARGGSAAEDVRVPVDLSALASHVVTRMSTIAGARTIVLRDDIESGVRVDANAALLERALVCVLHNAVKYTRVDGHVNVRVSSREGRVDALISDDGPGFSAAALDHAFERFWRDDEVRAADGHGLGLSLAKTIVERYGGRIELANTDTRGAVVHLAFPAIQPPPAGAKSV